MKYMIKCSNFKFTPNLIKYYNDNISSNNPIVKFSALKAFMGILESDEKAKIFPLVENFIYINGKYNYIY